MNNFNISFDYTISVCCLTVKKNMIRFLRRTVFDVAFPVFFNKRPFSRRGFIRRGGVHSRGRLNKWGVYRQFLPFGGGGVHSREGVYSKHYGK